MDGAIPPEPVRTQVSFVSGFDGACTPPKAVRSAGFTHRFAVIQETYRPDSADMYFDEALWSSLRAFATHFSSPSGVRFGKSRRLRRAANDLSPEPVEIHVRGRLILFIAPEFWTEIGGPAPYHDSYTYSLYSNEDISGRVLAHLRDSDTAHLWMLAADVMPARPVKRTLLGRLWDLIR